MSSCPAGFAIRQNHNSGNIALNFGPIGNMYRKVRRRGPPTPEKSRSAPRRKSARKKDGAARIVSLVLGGCCSVPTARVRMPSSEDGEHQLVLALPEGLKGDTACWAVRFTGEIFTDYEWVSIFFCLALRAAGGLSASQWRLQGAASCCATLGACGRHARCPGSPSDRSTYCSACCLADGATISAQVWQSDPAGIPAAGHTSSG